MKRLLLILLLVPYLAWGQHELVQHPTAAAAGSAFCTEFQTVYDAWVVKPDAAVAAAMNTMVQSLVNAGVWTKLDAFYLWAAHDGTAALVNMINPGTFDAEAIGSPTHTAYEGYVGGVGKRLELNYNPDQDATNYTMTDACYFLYCRTNLNDSKYDFGNYDGSTRTSVTLAFGGSAYIRLNDGGLNSFTNSDTRGFYIMNRTASNVFKTYRNDVEVNSNSQSGWNIPDQEFYALCHNNNGSAGDETTRQQAVLGFGASLDSDERTALMNAIETFMDSNSKGVIP